MPASRSGHGCASGREIVGKWFGQLITWMRVASAVSANTASGFEFSPQMSPLIGPSSVSTAPKVSPNPPVCTSRSPTVGISFWCLPRYLPSGPMKTWVLKSVPNVPGDPLADADDHMRARVRARPPGGPRAPLPACSTAFLKKLDRESGRDATGGRVEVEPDRMRRDEALGEPHQLGTVPSGLTDERARLLRRGPHGRGTRTPLARPPRERSGRRRPPSAPIVAGFAGRPRGQLRAVSNVLLAVTEPEPGPPDPGQPYPVPDPGVPYPVPDPGQPYPRPTPAIPPTSRRLIAPTASRTSRSHPRRGPIRPRAGAPSRPIPIPTDPGPASTRRHRPRLPRRCPTGRASRVRPSRVR